MQLTGTSTSLFGVQSMCQDVPYILLQELCLHRNSPHRGEFATFAKTVAIRGDFMLKCGKWRILLD